MLSRRAFAVVLAAIAACSLALAPGCATGRGGSTSSKGDPLPSWKDGPSRRAITSFVKAVTDERSPDFVPPEQRIAVFDNDGTLWAEQPEYFQFFFVMDRVKALAPQHPEWATTEPFKSALEGNMKKVLEGGSKPVTELMMATHTGMSTDEFEVIVRDWVRSARHPESGRPYTEMVYQPMLELLAYLRAHGFKTWIVSGGGSEFMRPWAETVYGIPPEQVIGSTIQTALHVENGVPTIVREPGAIYIDDGRNKALAIQRIIGRRPIAAFGNSDGDLQMLQWTAAGSGRRLMAYVHHDDAAREWSYDRGSRIGKLEKGLDEASARGWTVISMKDEWSRVFPSWAR
jgi:phosphoserine phosphatase